MNIRVSADSTCDLPQELLERNSIAITPLYIVMGEKTLRDGLECSKDEIFDYVRRTGTLCRTAAVSIGDYIDFFAAQLREHDAVVHFTISAGMSACFQNACVAAQEFPDRVFVVDSMNLSTGIGHLVLDAVELARAGKTAAEIKTILDEKRLRLNVSFVLDTLDFIYKGGRCSAVAAFGANFLNLKPCIEVRDGAMGVGRKYRGPLKKCILSYVKERLEDIDAVDAHRIFITDSGVSPDILQEVADYIRSLGYFEEVCHSNSGCTISNHCGPNCLGILYYNK